jgi:hypothetical protein
MRTYRITLRGLSPLLMHQDNIEWADTLKKWRTDAKNKKFSVKGDDRSPAFTWLGHMYHDDTNVAMPSDNLMRAFMEGGALVPVPDAKSAKTFKSQTQSGMLVNEPFWPVTIGDKPVAVKPLLALMKEKDFEEHARAAADAGFVLYVKRAKVGQSKHIRVRPRFDRWTISGTLAVWDDQITTTVLRDIASLAGEYKGLGDWRPSSKTPGPFGRFKATVEEVKTK